LERIFFHTPFFFAHPQKCLQKKGLQNVEMFSSIISPEFRCKGKKVEEDEGA